MPYSTRILCCLLVTITLTNCREKVLDEYYGRPDDLASPIYQQLQERGNFKNLIACIDKANYNRTLATAGYFTMFAPNDAAFEEFFAQQGYSTVEDIDSTTAEKIVRYALVYNAFQSDRLDDYQSATGWVPSRAFKRRTAYYDGVYDGVIDGQPAKVISVNRNGGYVLGDNNNKYIPYFLDNYLASKSISETDYNYFYPNSEYTGFNVADASVVTPDILAENGVIHETNKVILPLPSLEQYIASNPQYSVFKDLMEKYTVTYFTDPRLGETYKILTGSNDSVYIKLYTGLGVSPNNENFLKLADNDGQSDSWSMFVPTNDVLTNYINTVLLEKYTSLDVMPSGIITDLINAHMWQTVVFPSKFNATSNMLGEQARFDPSTNVVDPKILSNGFFYGTNEVQKSDQFHSVYGAAYLDPEYSLMTLYLQRSGLRSTITNPNTKFTLFMLSNAMLEAPGAQFSFDNTTSQWKLNGLTTGAQDALDRLVNLHIAITTNGEMDDLSGMGVVETLAGEHIKFNNNAVTSAGNSDPGPPVNPIPVVVSSRVASNGKVYYLNNKIPTPNRLLGLYLRDLGTTPTQPYYRFYQYLVNSGLLINATTGEISGVTSGTFFTVFVPTNDAMLQAVTDGLLPNLPPPAWENLQRIQVANFILYHLVPTFNIVPNGKESGSLETLYVAPDGEVVKVGVANSVGAIELTDSKGRKANVDMNSTGTNVLGNRAIIHQINTYLNYNK